MTMKITLSRSALLVKCSLGALGLALATAAYATGPAQTASSPGSTASKPAAELADAEVKRVDKDAKKMTLKHGPIKSLDMPAMTMVFQVRDMALLDKAKAGDKIKFSAEQREGAYVITAIEPVDKR
jgi:Cu(I)/Ag(I) efflux system periplasmic protein CusF